MKYIQKYKCENCFRTRTININPQRTNVRVFPPQAGVCIMDEGIFRPVTQDKG